VETNNGEKRKRPRKRYFRISETLFVQNIEQIAKYIEKSGSMIHAYETIWGNTLEVSYEQFTRYVRKHIRAAQFAAEALSALASSLPQLPPSPQVLAPPTVVAPQLHGPPQGRPAGTRTFRHNPDDIYRTDLI
jgi:hypothetical protein